MRVLQLAQFVPPVLGGEERHAWNLSRALADKGHTVTLLGLATSPDDPLSTVEEGVRLVRVRSGAARVPGLYSDPTRPHALPLSDPVVARAIRKEIVRGDFEIMHAHNWIVNSAIGPAARARVPLVQTLHDYSHACATKRLMYLGESVCAGPRLGRCMRCATSHYGSTNGFVTLTANLHAARRRSRHLARSIAVSSAVASAVQPEAMIGFPAPGLIPTVVPNFIPDDLLVESPVPPAPAAPLVFAGDLSADKGIETLLNAYALLPEPPRLVLAGRMPAGASWRFPPGVNHVGPLPHDQVVSLFRSASVVLVPSICGDACPTVVLEGMAAARPVIASSIGGVPDLVVDLESGLLVRPGDPHDLARAISAVLSDDALVARLGAGGLARARTFTVSAVVRRLENVYAEAITASSRAFGRPEQAGRVGATGNLPISGDTRS